MGQLLLFTIPRTSLIISILTTDVNTSSKYMPYLCKNSFANNRGLCLIISPLGFSFTLNNYLTLISLFPSGRYTESQVLFFSIDSIFSFIAQIYFGSLITSSVNKFRFGHKCKMDKITNIIDFVVSEQLTILDSLRKTSLPC